MENLDAERKTVVLIISTIRSGSTLLKALLGTAPDVSHLPEINFQKHQSPDGYERMAELSNNPIVLLKRPGWVNELRTYPRIPPFPQLKKIVLFRDVYETVMSIRRMVFGRFEPYTRFVGNRFLAETYWCGMLENLLSLDILGSSYTTWVKYEDLVAHPKEQTRQLFSFIGSCQKTGVSQYNRPEGHTWQWGQDDGSANIAKLEVSPPPPPTYANSQLLHTIRNSERITALRKRLGYPPLPEPEETKT